jgi:1,4-dihydroxy-2-naphthoyl-CoA synthase
MMRKKILLLGLFLSAAEGPSSKDGVYFCSGGDQNARHQGYVEKMVNIV